MHEETLHFDSFEAMESLFARDCLKNLEKIALCFSLKATSRDLWVKLSSSDSGNVDAGIAAIRELSGLHVSKGKPLTQSEFDQVLSACRRRSVSELHQILAQRIKVSPKKDDIIARSPAQLEYLNAMRQKDIVFGIGPAGTGKTYLAMAMAVSSFLEGKYSRIILTRPAMEAGENLGFLPGSLEEKILPYLRPLYDALYDMLDMDEARSLMDSNIIELAPLAFMRGRTLNHSFIILDEAQNTSVEQMMMFLTRLGFDSACVITGDPSQTDLRTPGASGLVHAQKTLSEISEIAFCRFTSKDVVRHGLVEKIINAYQNESKSPRKEVMHK
ncbi:MAG: PhoH family protein [Victivallales bacterium]|nr:PhoH family protein [Victivallales bacterium]